MLSGIQKLLKLLPQSIPVPLQIPAHSLHSKGLLARHRKDTARAPRQLYAVLNAAGKSWKYIAEKGR